MDFLSVVVTFYMFDNYLLHLKEDIMKRMVYSVTNKRSSLDTVTKDANNYLTDVSKHVRGYHADPDYDNNCIRIVEDATGACVAEIQLDTTKDDTFRTKYRKATPEDIKNNEDLYVRVRYPVTVDKQIPKIKNIKNLVDILTK